MNPFLLAVLAAGCSGDVVHTREGRKIEGRILDYEHFIEIEPLDPAPAKPGEGKKVRILKSSILKIDLAPNFIRCPEIAPFPMDQLEKGEYEFLSFQKILICLPRPPLRKVVAIDISLAKKVWEMDLPNRAGEPVLGGRILYFMQREKEVDDSKKYKVAGSPFSKEIHRLTITAVDMETCQIQWSQSFDNNDRKDLLWEFAPVPPTLHVLADRIIIRAVKIGFPMDAGSNVDKTKSVKFVTFYTYDPDRKKLVSFADSTEAAEMGGHPFFTEDAVITQVYQGQAKWKLASVSLRDGKLKWQSDFFTGGARLYAVTDDNAYLADTINLFAYSVKTGKKLEKWAIEYTGGMIGDIDYNFVYLYRSRRAPRAILAFDVKKAQEAWRIEMPDNDEFFPLQLVGHRLLYTDRSTTIHAYDTLQRKEMWSWKGPGLAPLQSPRLQGRGFSFYKDGRVTTLDVETGRKLWDVKQSYKSILQVGDAGVVAYKLLTGADIIHERRVPKGAAFFTPMDTPLRFALGEETWSIPAFAEGILYTLTGSGQLAAVDLKEKKLLWMQKIASGPLLPLAPTYASGGRVAVNVGLDTWVFDAEAKTKQYQVRHTPVRFDRQFDVYDKGILTVNPSGFALVDFASGQRSWDCPIRGTVAYTLAGETAYVLTSANLQAMDLKTGRAEVLGPAPRGATALAVDGKRIYVATGPYGLGESMSGADCRLFFKSKQQDPRLVNRFRGALATAGGNPIYAGGDGELVCYEGPTEKVAWSFQTPGFTSPLLVEGDRVWFAAGGQGLYGLDVKSGRVDWKVELQDAALFTPFLKDGKAAFWASEGWLVIPE